MTREQLLTWAKPRAVMKSIAQQAVFFALGLLSARAVVFGRCAPFGIAMAAACPWENALAAVLGAALGYILPDGAAGVHWHPMGAAQCGSPADAGKSGVCRSACRNTAFVYRHDCIFCK